MATVELHGTLIFSLMWSKPMSVGFQEHAADDELESPRGIASPHGFGEGRSTEIALSTTVTQLAVLDRCQREIQQAENLSELNDLRSKAEAVRSWAKSAKQSLEVQNRAAELKLLAERKAGKMLSQMRLQRGRRKQSNHDDCFTLIDLGVTQNQSTRWQKIALIGDEEFANYMRRCQQFGEEITAAGLLRFARGGSQNTRRVGPARQPRAVSPTQQNLGRGEAERQTDVDGPDDLQEAINHLESLQSILMPYATGQVAALSECNRRAAVYFMKSAYDLLRMLNGGDSS